MRTATLTAGLALVVAIGAFLSPRFVSDPAILAFDQAGILLGFALSCLGVGGALVALLKKPDLHRLLRRLLDQRAFENAGVRLARFEERVGRRTVRHYIDRLRTAGIPRQRIFVDTTGGTVPMSIGAFQAAEETGVSSIYVVGQATKDGRPGFILDPRDPHEGQPQFMSDHTGAGG